MFGLLLTAPLLIVSSVLSLALDYGTMGPYGTILFSSLEDNLTSRLFVGVCLQSTILVLSN